MEEDHDAAEAAFLEFFNTFDTPQRISSLKELTDATTLSKILHEIDPTFFQEDLPAAGGDPDSGITKWKRLQHLHKECVRYIRDEQQELSALHKNPYPNLRDIAVDDGQEETIKLLDVVLTVVIYSPRKTEYFQRMSTSSLSTQAFLMRKIQDVTESDQEQSSTITEETMEEPLTKENMSDLDVESQIAKLAAENRSLAHERSASQKAFEAHKERLAKIQENNEILREQLMNAEDKLLANEISKSDFGADANTVLRRLDNRIRDQDEIISQYESTMSGLQRESDAQRRTIDSFQTEREKAQRNQDLLDESRSKIDDLTRKANTAEHFKQKLEASQSLDKKNKELRLEIERLQARLRQAEEARKSSQGVQMTIEQYKRTQERIEQDHSQLQTVKRQLELDNDVLNRRLESAAEQQTRDTEVISEQQDRIRELESKVSVDGEPASNLETELFGTERSTSDLRLEVTKLKGDLQQVRDAGDPGAENSMLKSLQEESRKKAERFEKQFLDAQQSKLVLESEIKALMEGNVEEGSEPFIELRKTIQKHKNDLDETMKARERLEGELKTTNQEMKNLRVTIGMVDKDKVVQIEELKQSVSEELRTLQEEHRLLQSREKELRTTLETHKDLLNSALVDKDTLQKDLASEKDLRHTAQILNKDLKANLEAFESRKEGAKDVLEQRILQLQSSLDTNREKYAKRNEHVKKQKGHILELERRVREAEEQDADTKARQREKSETDQKNAKDDEITNLKRELSLMSTAWYDLTSRIQLPSASVQRRSEPPRSWLNKQRQLLNGPGQRR